MAIRIPWDKYETSILIEACQKYNNKKITRKAAVEQISKTLRQIAINKGIKIDNVYRNENGINARFSIINSLLNKKEVTLTVSKLFKDMVELYYTNQTEFKKILMEAKTMVQSNTFFIWIDNTQSSKASDIKSYFNIVNILLLYKKIIDRPLLKINDKNEIINIKNELAQNLSTIIYSNEQCNEFINVLDLYIKYLQSVSSEISNIDKVSEKISNYKAETFEETKNESEINLNYYKQLLCEKYKKGFRIDSDLEMKRFRKLWEQKFGFKLSEYDDTIRQYIKKITFQYNDFAYLPEILIDSQMQQKLLSYIKQRFKEGKKVIYYETIYKEFADEVHINSADMLKAYLKYINKGDYILNRNYISNDNNSEMDTTAEVRHYLISCNAPMKIDDIAKELSHISKEKIYSILSGSNSDEFVRNQKGEYFHADIIDLSDIEIDNISKLIQNAIDDKSFMSSNELIDTIRIRYPTIRERYSHITDLGMRCVIAYKLKNKFSFKGKVISAYGKELLMSDIFANYAKSHEYFTLTQLNDLKTQLDTHIYFDAIYANSLRISKEEFVSKAQAQFDIDTIDRAIDRFCIGEYITVSEIKSFGSFPYNKFPWNSFLLEHYISDYSKSYKLLHLGFNANIHVGVIVKQNSKLESFDEVITLELANNKVPLNEQATLDYLYNNGFLTRRKYSNIKQIISNAKKLQNEI